MKKVLIGLTALIASSCSPKIELNDYICLNSKCTVFGKELTGYERPRIFLTKALHPKSDSVSYELKWRDTTTIMARKDPSKADLALITYLEKTGGKSQMRWDLSQYNHVRDFTLIVRAHGYEESRERWHLLPRETGLIRIARR